MKLNFDGYFFNESGMVSADVIIHSGDGAFLFSLAKLGVARSAEVVECWAACIGLLKARDLGLNKVTLEGDCKNTISYLVGDDLPWPLDIKGLLMDCKNIMSHFYFCSLSWVKRSANKVAHVLTSKGLSLSSSLFAWPLDWLEKHLELDLCFPSAFGLA